MFYAVTRVGILCSVENVPMYKLNEQISSPLALEVDSFTSAVCRNPCEEGTGDTEHLLKIACNGNKSDLVRILLSAGVFESR